VTPKVKICGITRMEDALIAADAGADMLGLNFYAKSMRYLPPDNAQVIGGELRQLLKENRPLLIGVFVNATLEEIQSIVELVGLDGVQLSGDETPELLHALDRLAFKALRPSDADQAALQVQQFIAQRTADHLPSLLLDAYHPGTYGGTGLQVDVELAHNFKSQTDRLMLAGGLTPEKVAEIVRQVVPWGVDVASGVEDDMPGIKSERKMRDFIRDAKAVLDEKRVSGSVIQE
jgi:phosphoribosylanthranilate isomerase